LDIILFHLPLSAFFLSGAWLMWRISLNIDSIKEERERVSKEADLSSPMDALWPEE
jgi:predicted RNase H-related nuclease YkuK (DUF458 family)